MIIPRSFKTTWNEKIFKIGQTGTGGAVTGTGGAVCKGATPSVEQ